MEADRGSEVEVLEETEQMLNKKWWIQSITGQLLSQVSRYSMK